MEPEGTQSRFVKEMTVGDAMRLHADAWQIFAGYHLGGCSHCGINEMETIEQVCMGYGIPVDRLVEDLNTLFAASTEK